MFIERKGRRKKHAARPALDVLDALIEPTPRKPRKPREPSPELIRAWRCIVEFSDLVGAIEKRDLEKLKLCQSRLLKGWGLVVELSSNWEERWPRTDPERGDEQDYDSPSCAPPNGEEAE